MENWPLTHNTSRKLISEIIFFNNMPIILLNTVLNGKPTYNSIRVQWHRQNKYITMLGEYRYFYKGVNRVSLQIFTVQ